MAYEELLSWAENRAEWQQDTLRRLAQFGEFTETDLTELRIQIEKKVKLSSEDVPALVPLAKEHLSDVSSDVPQTVLGSLGPTRYVDR